MAKKIQIPSKPQTSNLEEWVSGNSNSSTSPVLLLTETEPQESEIAPISTKRLTLDIPESLHARIKSQCALRHTKMVDEIREMLEAKFPLES